MSRMITWSPNVDIYLHRDPVDFRKAINGLSLLVENDMQLSPFSCALFVFCNKRRDKIKIVYWDQTGFCLWQKRLEKQTFKWPKNNDDEVLALSHEQFDWLLRGLDITRMILHKKLEFNVLS